MSSLLQFDTVGFSYPYHSETVVKNLSFSLKHGEFLGILGADEAGKTTLAKLSNGLLLPTQGAVYVEWRGSLRRIDRKTALHDLRQRVAVVFSDPENQIVATTVEEEVAFGLGNLQVPTAEIRRRVATSLNLVGLRDSSQRSPAELSGGEQQKLCLASILVMQPACLVLDEPLTFLDFAARQDILTLLAQLHAQGQSILYLTSDPEELSSAQRVLVLKSGKIIAECSFAELWNDLSLLERAAIHPSAFMRVRDALRKKGYGITEGALTPEAVARDMIGDIRVQSKH